MPPSDANNPQLDLKFVRSCFPAFEDPIGAKTAFLENASGSYMVGHVLDKLMGYNTVRVQPYGDSDILNRAGEQMDAGKHSMADMLGVPLKNVYFGPSTTQNINTLALGCTNLMVPQSEIIVTRTEHEANIGAWERLCQRTDTRLRFWEMEPGTTELDLNRLDDMLTPSVKVVCVTHSSNILGTINPIRNISDLCKDNGSRLVVDGVSYAPHDWPRLKELKADAYCFSTYKTYGTHLGIMYVATDFVKELTPQCHYFLTDSQDKLMDAAGPDHAAIAGLAGLGEYVTDSYAHHFGNSDLNLNQKTEKIYGLMNAQENRLCQKLLNGISDLPLRIVGRDTMEGREANLALLSEKYTPQQLSKALADRDIAANPGDFYANRLLEALDIETGILRVSLSHYNGDDDIDRIIEAFTELH